MSTLRRLALAAAGLALLGGSAARADDEDRLPSPPAVQC